MADTPRPLDALRTADIALKQAQAQKALAESMKVENEARKAKAEAEAAENAAEQVKISTDRERWKRERELLGDEYKGVFRFSGSVDSASVQGTIAHLVMWRRHNPDATKLTFIINSPGGSVVDGVHLFDFLRDMSASGVHITTVATGMAASMGAILTQAGDTRLIMPTASFMLHEAAFGAAGKTGEVEDRVAWVKMIQGRFKHILAERSNLTEDEIEDKWSRKDWWMMPKDAVELGFFDDISEAGQLL